MLIFNITKHTINQIIHDTTHYNSCFFHPSIITSNNNTQTNTIPVNNQIKHYFTYNKQEVNLTTNTNNAHQLQFKHNLRNYTFYSIQLQLHWLILSQFSISEEIWWSFSRNLYLVLLNVSAWKFPHVVIFSSGNRIWCHGDAQYINDVFYNWQLVLFKFLKAYNTITRNHVLDMKIWQKSYNVQICMLLCSIIPNIDSLTKFHCVSSLMEKLRQNY